MMQQSVLRTIRRVARHVTLGPAGAMGLLVLAGAAVRANYGEIAMAPDRITSVADGALDEDPAPAHSAVVVDDTLQGISGKLRARFVHPMQAENFPFLRRLLGGAAPKPGIYAADAAGKSFAFIAMLPFSQKIAGRIGSYRVGFWPGEQGRAFAGKYGNPQGFIQVTPDNQHTALSDHFTLADFLTHDQQSVWPKYLVLHEGLVDKLELVLADLQANGYDAKTLHVMSGFRTPQYNEGGGDTGGRATLSRHQYGDAADVWVENGAGRMADLNSDGRVDARDASVVAQAAERVERAHPELLGGVGIYRATGAHGPFVHIDTRGYRARWGTA